MALLLLSVAMYGWAQTVPPPAVTEAALRTLCAEKARVIVVLSDENVYVAVRAESVTAIKGSSLEIARPSDTILIESKVRVLNGGGSERPTRSTDVLEVLTYNWEPPFEGGYSNWRLGDGTQSPSEFLQFKKAQTREGLKVQVKSILTWWCEEPGAQCHNPAKG